MDVRSRPSQLQVRIISISIFDPFTPGFVHANANDIEDVKSKINKNTCAIMMELIQGEGGVLPLDYDFVKEVAEICQQNDILLIIDEVQTGIGRCGSLYAYEQFDIQPDIVTTAKGLGNGLPIGGVLLNDKVKDVFRSWGSWHNVWWKSCRMCWG